MISSLAETSITCSKSPYHLLFRRLCELSLRSMILLFVYGPMPSTNYLNLSVVPLWLLHWLWSISRTSYTTPTYFTQVFLKIQHLSPLNQDGWKLLDLAWYRMAVAAKVNDSGRGQGSLTIKAVSEAAADLNDSSGEKSRSAKSISDAPTARIDDSPSPSIGLAAARLLEVEPEKEQRRNIARDCQWYAAGIAEQPGTGKLHHHLGLLSREVESEELRGVYHFVKRYSRIDLFDFR